jgi:plasmid replication initiation protein
MIMASMEHPDLLAGHAPGPAGAGTTNTAMHQAVSVTPSRARGRATIFDADILIFCISQLMAADECGPRDQTARVLTLTAHDLLLATGRETRRRQPTGACARRSSGWRARGSPPTS